MDLTPELAKTIVDYSLEKKGLKPKEKIIKSVRIKTTTDKDGNTTSKSYITYY